MQDNTVLVRAKVSTRDGQAKMICDKAWVITEENIRDLKKELQGGRLPSTPNQQETSSRAPSGVYLHIPKTPDAFKTDQLKHLFVRYQGNTPVYLKIGDNEYRTIKTSYRITVNDESKYQIQKLTGPNSMRLVG
jgi:hypothetical protein